MSDPFPSPSVPADRPEPRAVRIGVVIAAALLGFLLILSARTGPPVQARLGSGVELAELIRAEQARAQALASKVEELSAEVVAIEQELAEDTVGLAQLSERVEEIAVPAGLVGVRGPGLTVTLTDSRLTPAAGEDYNDYVIHEQDLQGVINALWAGGAEAMAVNGNRILSTTAIRCVGNVLLLHGSTYSPPYVVEAIGDQAALSDALDRDPAVARFERAVGQFQLGYGVEPSSDIIVPGYEGFPALQAARPVEEG